MSEQYSFRWGVELFDNKHTEIPNFVLAYYHQVPWVIETEKGLKSGVGITNTEMMFIIQLASFKYESSNGKASPSLTGTLRKRMGYKSNQGIVNVMQGLVEKGLLIITKREGRTSVYDFTPLSKRILKIALQNDPDLSDNPSTNVDYPKVPAPENPSTKLDGLDSEPNKDPSTNIDEGESTKLDGSRQQNLTQRRKEEKESKEKESKGVEINFNLPPHSHFDLEDKIVYYRESEADELIQAVVKSVTAKRLRLNIGGVVKLVNPENHVFYLNGGASLSPVVIGESEPEPTLSPNILELKNKLIDLTGAANVPLEGPRINAIKRCQEAAIHYDGRGITSQDIQGHYDWFRKEYWRGRQGDPYNLEILWNTWNSFIEWKENGDKHGKKPVRNGQSAANGQTSSGKESHTDVYKRENKDHISAGIAALSR